MPLGFSGCGRKVNNGEKTFCCEKHRRLALLLATAMLWSACKPGELEFQSFQPHSETALADVFNNTPAIRAAFTTINAK
jgi:hypothetical protein